MNGNLTDLLDKAAAAALLGVSVSTFDRCRERLGLRPVPGVRLKPIVFSRSDVERVRAGEPLPPVITAKTLLERTTIKPLRSVRAAARKTRGAK